MSQHQKKRQLKNYCCFVVKLLKVRGIQLELSKETNKNK